MKTVLVLIASLVAVFISGLSVGRNIDQAYLESIIWTAFYEGQRSLILYKLENWELASNE